MAAVHHLTTLPAPALRSAPRTHGRSAGTRKGHSLRFPRRWAVAGPDGGGRGPRIRKKRPMGERRGRSLLLAPALLTSRSRPLGSIVGPLGLFAALSCHVAERRQRAKRARRRPRRHGLHSGWLVRASPTAPTPGLSAACCLSSPCSRLCSTCTVCDNCRRCLRCRVGVVPLPRAHMP